MRNSIRQILLCVVIGSASGLFSSCAEEEDCSQNARSYLNCNIYSINIESGKKQSHTLDSLTITALHTDSVILNNQKNVSSLSLPLRYAADSTAFVLHYSKDETIRKDTLIVYQKNTPYFLSMDCGFQMKQEVLDSKYTHHFLSSIQIENTVANINGEENIQLFY